MAIFPSCVLIVVAILFLLNSLKLRIPYKIRVFLGCFYYTAISNKNIANLRWLIQTVSTNKLDILRNVLIRIIQHMCRNIMWSVHFHVSEPMEHKTLFILSHALLSKQDRTRIFNRYRQNNWSKNWTKNY